MLLNFKHFGTLIAVVKRNEGKQRPVLSVDDTDSAHTKFTDLNLKGTD